MATRRERVVLELEDHFTAGMARAAVATELLDKRLNSLSGSAVQSDRSTRAVDRSTQDLGNTAGGSSRQIDRMSGRLRILADVAAVLGPSLVPIGAVGIPAVTGLAAQFGFVAAAGGTAVIAFQGVGDALSAMNKAHLEPTAANLEAARQAMQRLGPDARHLVRYLGTLTDEWHRLRDVAAAGLFPGIERGLDALLTRTPEVISILDTISTTVGDILGDTGESFASPRWDEFFRFIDVRAPKALSDFAAAIGNVTHGVAELVMAFDPLNTDFSSWLVSATADFDRWADGLSRTEGFQEFVDYIRAVGPQVGQTLASLANALLQIVEAAAPIGAATLPILEAVADVVAMIADSDAGTPLLAMVAAMGLLSRTTAAWGAVSKASATSFVGGQAQALRALTATIRGQQQLNALTAAQARSLGKTAGLVTGGGLLASGIASEIGATNTAMGLMVGTIAGPWGAAIGGAIGLLLDLNGSQEVATVSANALADAIDAQTGAFDESAYVAVAESLSRYADTAADAGISLEELTSATLEGGSALDDVNARLDAYLSSLANTGPEGYEAAQAVGALMAALSGQNTEVERAVAMSHARQAGLDAAAAAESNAAGATDRHARSVERLSNAVSRLNDLLDARSAAREYEAALDDLTKSVKENGQAWSREGPKGRANLEALDRLAKAAGDQIDQMTEKGRVAAAQRVATRAISDLREFARENPQARAEVQKLIDKLRETDRQTAKPKIDADTDSAMRKLGAVRAALGSLQDKTITVRTIHMDTRLGPIRSATGGYVRGPGTTTSDSIPALLSDREYVVSAKAVEKYGVAMFDAINARRFASGGWTGWPGGTTMPAWASGGSAPLGGSFDIALQNLFDIIDGHSKKIDKTLDDFNPRMAQGLDGVRAQVRELRAAIKDAGGTWTKAMQEEADRLIEAARRHDVRKILRQFDLDLTQEVGGQLRELKTQIVGVGGEWTKEMDRQSRRIRGLSQAYGAATEAADASAQALADIAGVRNQFASSVSGSFNAPLFGSGLAGLDQGLNSNLSGATAMNSTLAALVAAGLDPTGPNAGLFLALAASGDLTTARQLLASGTSGIEHYEALFVQQAQATAQLGAWAADAAYAGAVQAASTQAAADAAVAQGLLNQANAVLRNIEKSIRENLPKDTGKAVGDAINSAATAATTGGSGNWGGWAGYYGGKK